MYLVALQLCTLYKHTEQTQRDCRRVLASLKSVASQEIPPRLTRSVANSWCLIHTHHTHTHPFQLLSHYPFSQHMMDTLQLEYLGLKLFSEGSRALVLAMYY